MDGRDQPQRPKRIALSQAGVLIDSDGVESRVVVTDLSADGCRLKSDKMLLVGERVHVRLGHGADTPALVRWVVDNEAGLSFAAPPDPAARGV